MLWLLFVFRRGSISHIGRTWGLLQNSTAHRKHFKVSCSASCRYPLRSRVLRGCQCTCTDSSSWVRTDVIWNGLRQKRETRQDLQMTHWCGTDYWSRKYCHEPTSRWSHNSSKAVRLTHPWSGAYMQRSSYWLINVLIAKIIVLIH